MDVRFFCIRPDRPSTHSPDVLYSGYPVSVPEDKATRSVALTTHSYPAPILKQRFELCICCPAGPSCRVLGWAVPFIGLFAKSRKATVSFVMSVRMELLGSHWTDFREI